MSDQITVDDLHVLGDMKSGGIATPSDSTIEDKHVATAAAIQRYKLAQETDVIFNINLFSFRVWDNLGSILSTTSSSDDLGIFVDTFGTGSPYIYTGDAKASTITRYARTIFQIPPEYDDFNTAEIVAHAGMITTIADDSANLVVKVHKSNKDGTVSSALVNTSTSINSTTFADKTLNMTATDLRGGDILDIRVEINVTDAATGTAVIGAIGGIELQCDVKG